MTLNDHTQNDIEVIWDIFSYDEEKLPKTFTPFYNMLLAGFLLIILSGISFIIARR